MDTINLADAKARLSELVARAEAGETIAISRRGKAVVELSAAKRPRQQVNVDMLKALTDSLPPAKTPAAELIRAMRDGDRY